MYTIYRLDGEIIHDPFLDADGRIVKDPVLKERLNTHGSLRFSIAPTHPLYNDIEPRNTYVKVVSDINAESIAHPWFGRVIQVENSWNNMKEVYCEGELGCLCDSIQRPFGFKGSPTALLTKFITAYNGSNTRGFQFSVGNVSVVDPDQNNLIVRSSKYPSNIWNSMTDKLFDSSLGGYIIPRYDAANDIHYIDYLSLDSNDTYAVTSSQVVRFGENLLDFVNHVDAEDVITVLIPYGAEFEEGDPSYEENPPENANWDGNRLTIRDAEPNRKDYIENANGVQLWGRIVGSRTWDDVTIASNLLTKATAWLAQQIWQSATLEISAVDLAFVDSDIQQIQVGQYVRCISEPHGLNVLLLCTEKETHLTALEESGIILGAGLKTITDLQSQRNEGRMN